MRRELPASTRTASLFRRTPTSYTLSTGVDSRVSHGILLIYLGDHSPCFFSDIDCSVFVPIMDTAAFRAFPFTDRQIFCFLVLEPAIMANLTAWIPLVNLDKLFPLPCKLVFEYIYKLAPTVIRYGFSKAEMFSLLAFRHCFDADIFNADSVVAIREKLCFLCRKSRRWLAICSCNTATLFRCFSRFLLSFLHLESFLCALASFFSAFCKNLG